MPKRLPRYAGPDRETKEWVRSLIRGEMAKRGITFSELAGMLSAAGFAENDANLRSKVSRGELSGAMLLTILRVMKCKAIDLQELSLSTQPEFDEPLTVDLALQHQLVHVVFRDDQAGTYQFKIGGLNTTIQFKLAKPSLRSAEGGGVYRVSHFINATEKSHSPPACIGYDVTLAKCLRKALYRLVRGYEEGIRSGRTPSEAWLKECISFRIASVRAEMQKIITADGRDVRRS